MLNLLLTARARRTSGSELTEPEGHGGGHRGLFGDATRLQHASSRFKPVTRSRSLIGRSSGQHTSQWLEQSGHSNALSPTKWVSPGQRVGTKNGELYVLQRSQADPKGTGCERSGAAHFCGVEAAERPTPADLYGLPRSYNRPYVPVAKASVQRERQTVYQTKQGQGLVVVRAVVPARGMPKGMGEVSLA